MKQLEIAQADLKRAEAELRTVAEDRAKLSAVTQAQQLSLDSAQATRVGLEERLKAVSDEAQQLRADVIQLRTEEARLRSEAESNKREIANLQRSEAESRSRSLELEKRTADAQQKVVVDFQAAVMFGDGNMRPVANQEFFVARRSVREVARTNGYPGGPNSDTLLGISLRLATLKNAAGLAPEPKETVALESYRTAVESAVASFRTDMSGRASPPDLPPGTYNLIGFATIGKAQVLWDH